MTTSAVPVARTALNARRVGAALAGVLLVALGAQAAIPIPGNPVPITLQVPAVLIVGGLLGPALGSATLVLYLLCGAAGLPVFAPTGTSFGLLRLFGPTGGYLLAYPVAAAVAGLAARRTDWAGLIAGLVLAVGVIHLGGVAQLAIMTGDVSTALKFGSLPFLLGDFLKILLACLVIRRLSNKTRALL